MELMPRLAALIVDEGKWLTASLALAAAAVGYLLMRRRGSATPVRLRTLAAMNLAGGVTIAAMAFGHLLAVATKLALGTLREGSRAGFVAIGVALLVPAGLVVRHTRALLDDGGSSRTATPLLNAWLAATLLVLGLHNLPLAAPALLTIAYRARPDGRLGGAIVGLYLVVMLGLFAASLVFLASGQSFEQLRGID
jgi:hypothetical protein